jgi:opacity protein-like surface antigen
MKKLITLILLSAASLAHAETPYVGGSVGYLVDAEEHYFTGRIGYEVARTNAITHSVEVEVGIVALDETNVSLDLVPVFANYRFNADTARPTVSYYGGAGLGSARLKASLFGFDDSGWTFAGQAFGGVEFKVQRNVSVTVGARYLYIDEVNVFGVDIEADDDFGIEVGIRIRL